MNNDETATQRKLYTCAHCGQVLGPPSDDGRIKVELVSGETWYLVQGVLDCACGRRQPVRRDERAVPPFVERHYPNGATE